MTNNTLSEEQIRLHWSRYATEIGLSVVPTRTGQVRNPNDYYRNSCEDFRAGIKKGFELRKEAGQWTNEQPTIEGFYLMRCAGRDSLELGLVQCDEEFKELCLFTGDSFDYFNTIQNLTRSIEWKFVASLSEGEKYA